MTPTDLNGILTDICNQLLDEGLTPEQVAALAADIPGECESIADNRAEDSWMRHQERLASGADNSGFRRDMIAAGRGHLLRD